MHIGAREAGDLTLWEFQAVSVEYGQIASGKPRMLTSEAAAAFHDEMMADLRVQAKIDPRIKV